MKQSQKKNLLLCLLATLCITQQLQSSFDCCGLTECWKALFSRFRNQKSQQTYENQAPIIIADPFQALEEEMQNRAASSIDKLPGNQYSNVKFTNFAEEPEHKAPANSLNNLSAATVEQCFKSISTVSSASSFDSCSSPTEEFDDKNK